MTALREKRVLIVECNPVVAVRMRETLAMMAFRLSFAATAAEARSCVAAGYFNLVILDERIPDQPFEELIASLLQAQSPPPCILFMLSRQTLKRVGNGAQEINALFSNGMLPDQIITKPFPAEELRTMVHRLL